MKTFYTYLWLREDGTPYYVGKGSGERAFISDNHNVPCPPELNILIQEFSSETEAYEAEEFLIAYYGRKDLGTGCLRNLTDGGIGGLSRVFTDEHRQRLSESFGEASQKHLSKLHAARIGQSYSAEICQRMSEGRKGMVFSDEHLKNLSRTLLGNQRCKGKKFSAETRRRMSEGQLRRAACRRAMNADKPSS
jgi:hypothetical protein